MNSFFVDSSIVVGYRTNQYVIERESMAKLNCHCKKFQPHLKAQAVTSLNVEPASAAMSESTM